MFLCAVGPQRPTGARAGRAKAAEPKMSEGCVGQSCWDSDTTPSASSPEEMLKSSEEVLKFAGEVLKFARQ